MKLVKKFLERDGSGYVTLRPEEAEDMWHAYNLIQEVRSGSPGPPSASADLEQGDEVRATAVR
jgi:hypothetical protein